MGHQNEPLRPGGCIIQDTIDTTWLLGFGKPNFSITLASILASNATPCTSGTIHRADLHFVGVCILRDLKCIGKDVECTECSIESTNCVNLVSHARKRDVAQHGTASLEKLVQFTSGEMLDKLPSLRLPNWSCPDLCDD
jgi:hypothetical protein